MAAGRDEILAVLDAVIRYLAIDLPCQSLTPDAQMGREALLNKVEQLNNRISSSCLSDSAKSESSSFKSDDVLPGEDKQHPFDKRTSSYVDMGQFLPSIEAHLEKKQDFEEKQDLTSKAQDNLGIIENNKELQSSVRVNEDEKASAEELYEIADSVPTSHSEANGRSAVEINLDTEDAGEFSDDELLEKLRGMGNTSPKIICVGSLCSGYMLKQKKKMLSKWNTRYCIIKDLFMFYYKSENDNKSLGVIVLPGYSIQIESKSKFIFRLSPTNKGRSTYLFQLSSETDMEKWMKVLSPICSHKLSRLRSDVFNRVAKHLDENAESKEGNVSDRVSLSSTQENGDMYEPITEDGLHSDQNQADASGGEIYDDVAAVQELAEEDEYDDHVGLQNICNISQPVATMQDDMYEGIPGESYIPETSAAEAVIQEDIYEDIPGALAPQIASSAVGNPLPSSLQSPASPAPFLPPRTPVLPPRGASVRPGNEEVPLPPSVPNRRPNTDEAVELIQEESDEEEPSCPRESDFSYENVYIGTSNVQSCEVDELTFSRGELIYILDKVDKHWWVGFLNDKVGYVRSSVIVPGFAH